MDSSISTKICRLCGIEEKLTINLVDTRLGDTLKKYFPLKFEIHDSLPKTACIECAHTIELMERFVSKAKHVEAVLLSKQTTSATSDIANEQQSKPSIKSVTEFRSLAEQLTKSSSNQQQQSVDEVLQKLKTSTPLTIKRVEKAPSQSPIENSGGTGGIVPTNDNKSRPCSGAPCIRMKMEVLEEEIEHLPAEDFVQYNDTDDESDNFGREHGKGDERNTGRVATEKSQGNERGFSTAFIDPPGNWFNAGRNPSTTQQLPHSNATNLQNMNPTDYKPRSRGPYARSSVVIDLIDPCHYVCVCCKAKFTSMPELQQHIAENVACKNINSTCEHCGKVCDNRRALYAHRQTHLPRPQLVCDQCGKMYTNVFNLENHKSQVHGEAFQETGYVYKCCNETFLSRVELNAHIATHTKTVNLLCDICGKSFTSHKALRSHAMSHQDVRPFSCDACDKTFRTKLLLVQHSHVHTGVKAFNCDICDKSFAKKESLKKHYRAHTNQPVSWSSTGEKISVKPLEQLQKVEYLDYGAIPSASGFLDRLY